MEIEQWRDAQATLQSSAEALKQQVRQQETALQAQRDKCQGTPLRDLPSSEACIQHAWCVCARPGCLALSEESQRLSTEVEKLNGALMATKAELQGAQAQVPRFPLCVHTCLSPSLGSHIGWVGGS